MKLSKNLTLTEVIKSNTAIRNSIDNKPNKWQLKNLISIAKDVFQPIREHFNVPIYISSGFRSKALNELVNGSQTSHHSKGMALDIDMDGRGTITNENVFYYIKNYLKFTQLIWEYGDDNHPEWVHVSYDKNDLRGEILESYKENKKTKYKVWKEC